MRQLQREWLIRENSCSLYIAVVLVMYLCALSMPVWAEDSSWPDDEFDWLSGSRDVRQVDQFIESKYQSQRLSISGYLKNETAYRYDEPRSITKIRNILYLKTVYSLTDNFSFLASGWTYYDLVYQLFDYETISARFVRDDDKPLVFVDSLAQKSDSSVIALREFYLDVLLEDVDIRLGKQYILWGVFDGIRITDEINPQDFRELVLLDLLDYRIPLWSLKIDYYHQDDNWQFLWIPDIRFHKPAPRGSEWELLQEVSGETVSGKQYFTTYPNSFTFVNSEYGLRYKTHLFDAELSFSYFHTWDDFPVIFRTVKIDSSIEPDFFPVYTQINIFGASVVKSVGRVIVKAEVAWVPDKYFGLDRDVDVNNDGFLDGDGVKQLKHYRWALGIDFNAWGIDLSPAINQWLILDYIDGLIQDRNDTSITLFARKPIPEKDVVLELLVISLVNMGELYLKPQLSFAVSNQFKISLGMNLFYGDKSQLGVSATGGAVVSLTAIEQSAQFFGNFRDNDRVFFEFKYTF